MTEVQNRKNRDLYKGFGVKKDDLKRAVDCPYLIDTNKRKGINDRPKLTE